MTVPGERTGLTGLQGRLDRAFATLALYSARHSRWVVGAATLLLLLGVYAAAGVRQDNSLDAYFNDADPIFRNYEDYVAEFQSDEVIYLVYSVPEAEHGPFELDAMRKIDRLTRTIDREVPFVRKVTSLTNVELMESEEDDILIHELMLDFPETQEELLRLREIVLGKPLYVGTLVSPDAQHAAIVVEMTRASTDPIERLRLNPERGDALSNLYPQASHTPLREILTRPEYDGIDFLVTGDVPMNTAYNEVMTRESGLLLVFSFVAIAVAGAIFFPSTWIGLAAPLAIVVLTLVLTVALMAVADLPITLLFIMVPSLLCAVGVAQSVHLLFSWERHRADGGDRREAVRRAVEEMATPCLLAALTTAVGMLGMSVSRLKVIREFGFYAGGGVLLGFFLSLVLLIAFASGRQGKGQPGRNSARMKQLRRLMGAIAEWNIRRPYTVLAVFGGFLLVAAAGMTRLSVDFNFIEEFKPHVEWRAHSEAAESIMGGLLSVIYVIETGREDGIKSPEIVHGVAGLQAAADANPLVRDSHSIADILKELNKVFHGDDPAYYALPENRDEIAQLLLVYELSGGKEMNDIIDIQRSKTVLELRVKMAGSRELVELTDEIDRYLAEHPIPGATVRLSGIGRLWLTVADYIAETQAVGYLTVFVVIGLFLIVAFGSLRVAALAMIPNLLPVIAALGLMGWIGWSLDYFRILLAAIAIGIAVDDTIHLVARYRVELAECGDYEEALRRALDAVGPALLITTAILAIAFAGFTLSEMAVVSSFGVLLSSSVVVALLADLFLMPVLILVFRPFGEREAMDTDAEDQRISAGA